MNHLTLNVCVSLVSFAVLCSTLSGQGRADRSGTASRAADRTATSGGSTALVRQTTDWKTWLDAKTAGFSGVALVGRGDAIEAEVGYGMADRGTSRRNSPDTRFNLGSINKTFTAIAIAQLMQQGRLSLDDTLATYLPDYPNRAVAARVTIRHLLTHRSGIAPFMRADFGAVSVAAMVTEIGAQPQAFEPGTRQAYSNGGYVVLGRVIEVLSGKQYAAYVSDHVFTPAGMESTGFFTKGGGEDTVALGYPGAGLAPPTASGDPAAAPSRPRPGNPAGGGYSTAADLFRFSRALRRGRLLDRRMTEYVLNGTFAGEPMVRFGFALREQIVGSRRFIGNGGGAPGVNAEFRFEPSDGYTVVVLANSSPPAATELLTRIVHQIAN